MSLYVRFLLNNIITNQINIRPLHKNKQGYSTPCYLQLVNIGYCFNFW